MKCRTCLRFAPEPVALLARHPLRAAGAGQLAAALLVQEQLGSGLAFVCLDQRLSLAAERESLRTID